MNDAATTPAAARAPVAAITDNIARVMSGQAGSIPVARRPKFTSDPARKAYQSPKCSQPSGK